MIAICVATSAVALPPLSSNERVTNALRDARIADEIRSECEAISQRDIALFMEVGRLQRYVKSLGYDNDQVDDFMKSKSERRRIYGLADSYMASNGVSKGDAESYCALGRKEIASESLIGSLLRER